MGVRTVEVNVNNNVYSYNTYTAKRGLSILRRLTTILGPSFAKLVSNVSDDSVDIDFLEPAIKELVLNLDNDDIEKLILEMTQEVMRDNKPISFDLEFAENYGTLLQILISIVKENYSSLFTESGISGIGL